MLTSILGIIVCIVCLCSTTFAWFTDVVPSNGNEIIISDECLVTVRLSQNGEIINGIEDGVELEAGEYEVTISLPPNTASGYCLIDAGGVTYYTDYILRHTDEGDREISFDLTVNTAQSVTFTTRWGIYRRESSVVDGKLMIP